MIGVSSGGGGGAAYAYISVTYPAGSVCTCVSGGTTLTAPDTSGAFVFEVPSAGSWVITATDGVDTATKTVTITSQYQIEFVGVYYAIEFGVSWDRSSSTSLTRLGFSASFANPVPAVNSGDGSSPFDDYYPWSEMKEFNVINDTLSYEKGVDAGFSRTSYDTVVRIPKFYYKVVSSGATLELWISTGPMEGYTLHPAFEGKDFIYISRYLSGSSYDTKSGISCKRSLNRPTWRTGARAKGTNWDLINVAVHSAVQMLYIVEFANWDSQTCIGTGSSSSTSGITDPMNYHTGAYNNCVQYRGIENLWNTNHTIIDGVNVNGQTVYYCTDRSLFADGTSTNYTDIGFTVPSSDSFIKELGDCYQAPWLLFAKTAGGAAGTYIPDKQNGMSNGWKMLVRGGPGTSTSNGLFAQSMNSGYSATVSDYTSRLIFMP